VKLSISSAEKMSGFLCLKLPLPLPPTSTATTPPPPPHLRLPFHFPSITNHRLISSTTTSTWLHNTLVAALSGALSFGFLFSLPSPSSLALQTCADLDPPQEFVQTASQVVTNEGLVQEAWQIVNDAFLDTGRHRWSQDSWQVPPFKILHLFPL
jgi:hypothetical protein